MDDRDNRSTRGSGAASRPPDFEFTEDTPLFTDVPYTPIRRTGNNGRPSAPASPASSPWPSGSRGGRIYSAPERPSGGARPSAAPKPQGKTGRTSPVYTELSWDDLMRGTDSVDVRRQAANDPHAGGAALPQSGAQRPSGSQYFGGFDREMEELFYGRTRNEEPSAEGNIPAVPRGRQPSAPRSESRAPVRPQSTRRPAPHPDNAPAPARRAAITPARSQWSGVFSSGNPAGSPSRTAEPAPGRRNADAAPVSASRRNGSAGRARSGGIPPLFLGGGLALLVLLIFLIAKLSGTGTGSARPAAAPVITAAPAPEVSFEPVLPPEPQEETTPAPTPEPSPTPAGPKAKLSGGLVVPADWGPVIPERSRAVYDSFFDKSCMVGNSLVEGFFMWAGMTNMRYIYHTGATVSDAIGKLDLAPITLNPPGYYENIYLLFGLNEIGTDVNSFVQGYKKLVDFIRQYQPTANIILISVTPVTRQVDGDPNEVQSMDRIRTFNSALTEFCVDQNCWYLDIYHLLLDKDGYLSGDYAFVGDGKHFEKSGYVAWANYMKTHYVDSSLPDEK